MKISKTAKRKMNRSGVVLITVVTIMMMMTVIVSASLGFVQHETKRSYDDYKYKQAFYTASSCLESFMEQATKVDTDTVKAMKALAEASASTVVKITDDMGVDVENIGECTLTVEKAGTGTNALKATAVCEYLGQEAQVVAYFNLAATPGTSVFDNALEITGQGDSPNYNNMHVIGDVGKISSDAHKVNSVYSPIANNNHVYGNMEIKGSVILENFRLHESALKQDTSLESYEGGCGISASRSIFQTNNDPNFYSKREKTRTTDESSYNFIKAGEVVGLGKAHVGEANREVDIYGGTVVFGTGGRAGTSGVENIIEAAMTAYDTDGNAVGKITYPSWSGPVEVPTTMAQDYVQYGNIYAFNTYEPDDLFNGDVIFTNRSMNCTINGDIYAEGDVYFYGMNSGTTVNGNIYCTGNVYGSKYTCTGEVKEGYDWKTAVGPRGITSLFDDDGDLIDPSTGDKVNAMATRPYTYYPEHFLCLDDNEITNISDTYKSFYEHYDAVSDSEVYTYDPAGRMILNPDGDMPVLSGMRTDYTDSYGTQFKYVVTESCIFDEIPNIGGSEPDHRNILVTVPSDKDIVIVLKDGLSFAQHDNILVKNESSEDDPHFCYIVSDAGVGTVHSPVDIDSDDPDEFIAKYDSSTFKDCSVYFQNSLVMDYDTYYKSNLSGASTYLNPTDKDDFEDGGITGEKVEKSKIVMLLTEGTHISCVNASLFQAAIYGPEAQFSVNADAPSLNFIPATAFNNIGVMGMAVVGGFECNANNYGILYQPLADNSILKNARPSKSSIDGFKLSKYARS